MDKEVIMTMTTTTLHEIFEAAFDASATIDHDLSNRDELRDYIRAYARGAFNFSLSDSEVIAIMDAYQVWESREWDSEYQRQYDALVADPLDQKVGRMGCEWDQDHGEWHHPYATFMCPECGRDLCWSCGVSCTNDSTGEGFKICPCGWMQDFD